MLGYSSLIAYASIWKHIIRGRTRVYLSELPGWTVGDELTGRLHYERSLHNGIESLRWSVLACALWSGSSVHLSIFLMSSLPCSSHSHLEEKSLSRNVIANGIQVAVWGAQSIQQPAGISAPKVCCQLDGSSCSCFVTRVTRTGMKQIMKTHDWCHLTSSLPRLATMNELNVIWLDLIISFSLASFFHLSLSTFTNVFLDNLLPGKKSKSRSPQMEVKAQGYPHGGGENKQSIVVLRKRETVHSGPFIQCLY